MSTETKIYLYLFILIVYLCYLFTTLADYKTRDRTQTPPILLLFFCILHTFAGMGTEIMDAPGKNYILQYFFCTLYPVSGYFSLYYYGRYFIDVCGASQKKNRIFSIVNHGFLLVNLLATLPFIPSGLFFSVSKDCVYTRGALFFLSYVFVFTEMLLIDVAAVLMLKEHKKLLAYLTYGSMPIFTNILMLFLPMSAILNDGVTLLSWVILYALVYVEERRKSIRNEVRLLETESDVLLSRIEPHFIYNTLSTISALCTVNPELAQKLTDDFADYLRNNLNLATDKRLSAFSEELSHTEKYVEIEKIRFGNRIAIRYDIRETDFMLPTLCLQPLVENAVKHGITKKPEGGTVTVSTRKQGTYYVVTVHDDGVGFNLKQYKPQKGHYGLLAVKERVAILCDGEMKIESTEGKGTTVTVMIQKQGEIKP